MKDEHSNEGVYTRSCGCVISSWCEVVIKRTSHEANGTMQPQLMSASPIGHTYTNFSSEC